MSFIHLQKKIDKKKLEFVHQNEADPKDCINNRMYDTMI